MIPPFAPNDAASAEPVYVYGDWDSEQSYQFAIVGSPCLTDCSVMLMDGVDYGGGIREVIHGIDEKKLLKTIEYFRENNGSHSDFCNLLKSGELNYESPHAARQ